jgi:hypothetical protein
VLLTAYTAATAAQLIADINAADKSGGASTITLTAPSASPYVLSAVNNNANGANGLPVIGTNKAVNLTIIGSGDLIERSQAAGTPAFRLFDVAGGSSLTLESVTLQNGLAQGSGAAADGGAVYSLGSLTLIGATLQDNTAQGINGADGQAIKGAPKKPQPGSPNGQPGADAAGGALWSSGSVTLEGGSVLQQNQAQGGQGGAGASLLAVGSGGAPLDVGGAGGSAFGGGLYEAGGSVTISDATLALNTASGGAGGNFGNFIETSGGAGGVGAGGGLYVAQGSLTVSSTLVQSNQALGGSGGDPSGQAQTVPGNGGDAYGGGIDVAGGTASIAMTNLVSNVATGGNSGAIFSFEPIPDPANAFGGGLYFAGGSSTLTNDTVSGNGAFEGALSYDPPAPGFQTFGGPTAGGGIEIAAAATVSLDTFTLNNTANNYIGPNFDGGPSEINNINGTYILLP